MTISLETIGASLDAIFGRPKPDIILDALAAAFPQLQIIYKPPACGDAFCWFAACKHGLQLTMYERHSNHDPRFFKLTTLELSDPLLFEKIARMLDVKRPAC